MSAFRARRLGLGDDGDGLGPPQGWHAARAYLSDQGYAEETPCIMRVLEYDGHAPISWLGTLIRMTPPEMQQLVARARLMEQQDASWQDRAAVALGATADAPHVPAPPLGPRSPGSPARSSAVVSPRSGPLPTEANMHRQAAHATGHRAIPAAAESQWRLSENEQFMSLAPVRALVFLGGVAKAARREVHQLRASAGRRAPVAPAADAATGSAIGNQAAQPGEPLCGLPIGCLVPIGSAETGADGAVIVEGVVESVRLADGQIVESFVHAPRGVVVSQAADAWADDV